MLLDSRLVPETIVRPRSFVGLMSIYESNYLRLLHLIPDLDLIDGCFRSRVAGDCDLYVDVLERERYTVTLALTYRFTDDDKTIDDPDLRVRVYLDGQLAEAMNLGHGPQQEVRHAVLRRLLRAHGEELDARWRRNVVLNKWLEYLLDQGHLVLDR